MILKRYGTSYHSVELNFDSKALNEIGFRRDRETQIPVEAFEEGWTLESTHELTAEAEGRVQDATEADLLDKLEYQIRALLDDLESGQALVFENTDGQDYPKTRQSTQNVVVEGENKLHFTYTVAPALRFGVYRETGSGS